MPGLVFDKYEIIRRLAVGGMGEIFLARQHGIPGFDRLVITGRADKPVFLFLTDCSVQIKDAREYWRLNVPDTQSALEQDLGKGVRSAVIGPAGENMVRFANIMNSRKNAAGRGGMGAVMGRNVYSKRPN